MNSVIGTPIEAVTQQRGAEKYGGPAGRRPGNSRVKAAAIRSSRRWGATRPEKGEIEVVRIGLLETSGRALWYGLTRRSCDGSLLPR